MEPVGERGGDGNSPKRETWVTEWALVDDPSPFGAALLVAPNFWHTTRAFVTPPDAVTGIIALGGSHERIVEAARLAKQYPRCVTGASPIDQSYAQAQGLTEGRLVIEPQAKTTYENALFSCQMLAPDRNERNG